MPSNDLIDPDPGNNATFDDSGYTIGSPYYRTEVGAHENSDSPYHTFDQGGNVMEWNESVVYQGNDGSKRGLRGGYFLNTEKVLHASTRSYNFYPNFENSGIGFRVSELPEPATIVMLMLGGLGLIRGRRTTCSKALPRFSVSLSFRMGRNLSPALAVDRDLTCRDRWR